METEVLNCAAFLEGRAIILSYRQLTSYKESRKLNFQYCWQRMYPNYPKSTLDTLKSSPKKDCLTVQDTCTVQEKTI